MRWLLLTVLAILGTAILYSAAADSPQGADERLLRSSGVLNLLFRFSSKVAC